VGAASVGFCQLAEIEQRLHPRCLPCTGRYVKCRFGRSWKFSVWLPSSA
jgi:hypothetical protein